MNWLLLRLLSGVLAMLAGAVVGHLLGAPLQWPIAGVLVGGGLGVGLVAVFDTIRSYRLIQWLRGAQERQAPRDIGFWGELGYRVERALRQREQGLAQERLRLEQFLSAIEASPNGVLLLDANDQIEWCNRMAAAHFGLDPQRDRRQRLTNLVRAPAFVDYLQRGCFDEPVVFSNPRRDGTLSVLVRAYGDGMKLVLTQDITDRERTEAMRRDFVANVSHEIRSPLTVLAGFIETMSNLPLTEAERQRVLLLMAQQTERMQALVSDLLTLAQIEGSPPPPTDRWVPVDALLRQAEVDALALSAGRHTIVATLPRDVQLAGGQNELFSAVMNLMNNAVRYTPEGGRIELRWELLPDGAGRIVVSDTGPGIAREHLPRLAERFYRVDGSRSRETGGTGLGLSIVKHVIQRHGGELEIRSEPGKGSTFSLLLPAARVRTAPVPKPAVTT